ncbi:MAG: hypothetical protein AB1938_29935 [Myxococcota bacterium]
MSHLRIAAGMLADVRKELHRPHAFAYERVGFILCRGDTQLLVAYDYVPLHDDEYELAPGVGAQYSTAAITRMLRLAREQQACVFNVHKHWGVGLPSFSDVDLQSLTGVMPAFFGVARGPHGAVVLNEECAAGLIWTSAGRAPAPLSRVTEVGAPLRMWRNDGLA